MIRPARIVLCTGLERLAAGGDWRLLLLNHDLFVSVCWSVQFRISLFLLTTNLGVLYEPCSGGHFFFGVLGSRHRCCEQPRAYFAAVWCHALAPRLFLVLVFYLYVVIILIFEIVLGLVFLVHRGVVDQAVGHGLLLERQLVQVLLVVGFPLNGAAAARWAHWGRSIAAVALQILPGHSLWHLLKAASLLIVLIDAPWVWSRQFCAALGHYYCTNASFLVYMWSVWLGRTVATVRIFILLWLVLLVWSELYTVWLRIVDDLELSDGTDLGLLRPDHHVVAFRAEGHQWRCYWSFAFSQSDASRCCAALVLAHAQLFLLNATSCSFFLLQDPVIDRRIRSHRRARRSRLYWVRTARRDHRWFLLGRQ